MLHFFVSQGLSEQIPSLLVPGNPKTSDVMCWHCHTVPTVSGEFVILMEEQTHYCVLIHCTSQKHFNELPVIFKHRMHREVVELTQASEKLAKRIGVSVLELCKHTQFSVGLDYNVSADLFDIACQLQYAIEDVDEFPTADINEQTIARLINMKPVLDAQGKEHIPLERFQQYWLNTLGITPTSPIGAMK